MFLKIYGLVCGEGVTVRSIKSTPVLQIVDVPERPGSSGGLEYDPEWLAILKATNSLQRITPHPWNPPDNNGLHERYRHLDLKLQAEQVQSIESAKDNKHQYMIYYIRVNNVSNCKVY